MNTILKHLEEEPVDMTYLGIGSFPSLSAEGKLDPKNDQLIPLCFHDMLLLSSLNMRIIHFDPAFDRCVSFLNTYFNQWNLVPLEFEDGWRWLGNNLEVLIIPERLEHDSHFPFFTRLTNTILDTKGKLIIQEYTGYELQNLNKKLYDSCKQKEKYKRRILLDMTFGTDIGCGTDMTKVKPFYDNQGNFLNPHFMDPHDILVMSGVSTEMKEILIKKYRAKFCMDLNSMHVDYRRKLKGDTIMYGSSLYSENSTPEEIMNVLQERLRASFEVLLRLDYVDKLQKHKLNELFAAYPTYDPYKWYDAVYKLIPS